MVLRVYVNIHFQNTVFHLTGEYHDIVGQVQHIIASLGSNAAATGNFGT